jgi:tryptophan-rich sensory protein
MGRWPSLLLFLVLVVGGGLAIGLVAVPGEWYAALVKPSFNPPPWIFGPVWTVLYVAIAVAGWRIWRIEHGGPAMVAWGVQLALNFIWSPVFFLAHNPPLALAILLAMLAVIVAFILLARRLDAVAAWLFVPYALWVAFAGLLNASIWWLN